MSMLSELSDVLLGAGALGAAFYCLILSRRLRRFTDLERGMGGAVAALSAQVDDLQRTLQRAEGAARGSVATLGQASDRAEAAGKRLELLLASLHDLPAPGAASKVGPAPSPRAEAGLGAAFAPAPAPFAASASPTSASLVPASPVFVRHPAGVRPAMPLAAPPLAPAHEGAA